jgi:RNA polymerase sigma-70 factor, ECF subfamily
MAALQSSMTVVEPGIPHHDPLSDSEVVRRVVAGETALFEIIMRRYNQRIYRAIRAIIRDESETEDAMQQAYVNAYTHLHQFAERSSFATWLTRIAINEALARVKPRSLRLADDTNEMLNEIESTTPNPEQQAVATELKNAVETEIAGLPESFRTVLMLREVEGLSTAETAECLGVNEDLVKQRLHRARTMLRDNLYRRAGLTLEGTFTFGQARCDRVVAGVMTSIAMSSGA